MFFNIVQVSILFLPIFCKTQNNPSILLSICSSLLMLCGFVQMLELKGTLAVSFGVFFQSSLFPVLPGILQDYSPCPPIQALSGAQFPLLPSQAHSGDLKW